MRRRIQAIRSAGTDAQLDVYEGLGHGFGLGEGDGRRGLARPGRCLLGAAGQLTRSHHVTHSAQSQCMRVRAVVDAGASWLLGTACPTCGAPTWGVCEACLQQLAEPAPAPVQGTLPVMAAHDYVGVWREAVIAVKERGARSLLSPLAQVLALTVVHLLESTGRASGGLYLASMPSRPAAIRQRGLDSTWALACRAASVLARGGVQASAVRPLRYARRVVDQTGLNPDERHLNLSGALTARPPVGPVVVIDDLTTTGASLHEAVRALRAAGASVLGAAVICVARETRGPGVA